MKRKGAKQSKTAHDHGTCECGGRLRPAILRDYDFSGYAGMPVRLEAVPGLRCAACAGEALEGGAINLLLKIMVVEIAKKSERLTADEAKFMRRILMGTQQELATRMGIARETVAKWECGETISPQHDLILRIFVLAPLVREEGPIVPVALVRELVSRLSNVRVAPPEPRRIPVVVVVAKYVDLRRPDWTSIKDTHALAPVSA